jgi:alkylhydroperoxidase family enzyme
VETPSPLEGFLGHRPELLDLYQRFYASVWEDSGLDPGLLELCRLRIAAIHQCQEETSLHYEIRGLTPSKIADLDSWRDSSAYSAAERAALTLAEQMPWEHHTIHDDDVARAREQIGTAGTVALVIALALFDGRCRLRLAFGLPGAETPVPAPSATGPLH